MTVIAIRDGTMAIDSLISQGVLFSGYKNKLFKVPEKYGGGWIGIYGNLGRSIASAEMFCKNGEIPDDNEFSLVHMMRNGSVKECDSGKWFEIIRPFYTFGCGAEVAVGAMAAGASAKEAVTIACQFVLSCGGEIHEVKCDD